MAEELYYDVVVVGAGPGGSSTARFAAENGAKVLMIEKRQEIGVPVRCGEGIAKVWLDEIGMEPNSAWIANEVDGARIIAPDGATMEIDSVMAGNECGFVVLRDIFDKHLAAMAARSGAEIWVKAAAVGLIKEDDRVTGVKVRKDGEIITVKCKVVIGADGYESKVGRWAGIDTNLQPRDVNTCVQYVMAGIEVNPRFNDFYVGSCAPGGYIWVFTKGTDMANVGIGVNLDKIEGKAQAKYFLDKWIESHPQIARGQPIQMVAGAISCGMPIDRTVADGIMLVGDAARQIDPLTGGGIANACKAGKIAGEVAAKAVKSGDVSVEAFKEYEKAWREMLENHLIRNYIAKEKLLEMSDDMFNKLIGLLSEVNLERVTTLDILKAVQQKYPELAEEFADLL